MAVIVFESIAVGTKRYIWSGVYCPLCSFGYADTILKLQADRCISELMWVYPRQVVYLCEIMQPVSRCAWDHKIPRIVSRKEYCLCKVIPLVAVGLCNLIIMLSIFFQHIHSFIVHVKPTVTCFCLAAFLDSRAQINNHLQLAMPRYFNSDTLLTSILPLRPAPALTWAILS